MHHAFVLNKLILFDVMEDLVLLLWSWWLGKS